MFHLTIVEDEKASLDFLSNHILEDIFFHKSGKIVIIHNQKISPPENIAQKLCGTHIKNVVAFKSIEKTIIDIASEAIIIYGHFLLFSSTLQAKIIGRSGKTQGAKIVRTHAKNEIINKSIFIN